MFNALCKGMHPPHMIVLVTFPALILRLGSRPQYADSAFALWKRLGVMTLGKLDDGSQIAYLRGCGKNTDHFVSGNSSTCAVSRSNFSYSSRRRVRTSIGIEIGHKPSIALGLSDIWSATMARTFGSLTTLPLHSTVRPQRVMVLLIRVPVQLPLGHTGHAGRLLPGGF